MVDWRKTILVAPIPCVRGFRSNHKTVEFSFLQALDLCLRLVTSTCAGYDDDAQIYCEHGGEGGQNVFLTAEVHETTVVTSGGDGPGRCFFSLLLCTSFFSHFTPYLQLVFILVRGSLMKAGGGWREPPAVACSSRNAA